MRKAVSGYLQGVRLMLSVRKKCPVDYRLCTQTVTVYHKDGDTFTRAVHKNAFLDFRKTQTVDKIGSREEHSFLLVIPGASQTVFVGDKVMFGEGPEIAGKEAWAAFIPSRVSGLVVVRYADTKFLHGQIVHTEAGG